MLTRVSHFQTYICLNVQIAGGPRGRSPLDSAGPGRSPKETRAMTNVLFVCLLTRQAETANSNYPTDAYPNRPSLSRPTSPPEGKLTERRRREQGLSNHGGIRIGSQGCEQKTSNDKKRRMNRSIKPPTVKHGHHAPLLNT